MADYDNSNRGSIWKNKDKKSDKQPDFTGTSNVTITNGMTNYKDEVIVDNVERFLIKDSDNKIIGFKMDFYVNAWRKKDGANESAPSLTWTVSPKSDVKEPVNVAPAANNNFGDEDIPF